MKKIAFFVQHMLCGGVENALLALATELEKQKCQVHIYVLVERGEFIEKARRDFSVQKIPMSEKLRDSIAVGGIKLSVKESLQDKNYIRAANLICYHLLGKSNFAELKVNFSKIPKLNESFDIAVNYHMHAPFLVKYLDEKVEAKRKFTWIHNDFGTTGYDICALKKHLRCNDRFFGVSQQVVGEFTERLPEYKDRTELALNIVQDDTIVKNAQEFYPGEYKGISQCKILTVGRLEEQKGYDLAIEVCRLLKTNGYPFKWYVLGEGTQRKSLEQMIRKYHLEECFVLLGTRMNPYPYFANCDLYVQTSRHEGYVTTVTEAKVLKKPIVSTDVSGAKEQIDSGVNGYVVDIQVESIYEKVSQMVEQEEIRNEFSSKLSVEKCRKSQYLRCFK